MGKIHRSLFFFLLAVAFVPLAAHAQVMKFPAKNPVSAEPPASAEPDIRPSPEAPLPPIDITSVSNQLTMIEDLFSGGGGQTRVVFDAESAKNRGVDAATLQLADELTAYTNDLIDAADDFVAHRSAVHPLNAVVSHQTYPLVDRFFRAAREFEVQQAQHTVISGTPAASALSVQATGSCWAISAAACTCGHWLNPQPSVAKDWVIYKFANPAATLQSWGYHQTSSIGGGGWTRTQTYYPSRCGTGTFRDHALIQSDGKSLREQNYAGWTPRGEPNPEFWLSAVWAYPLWPAYVKWWHDNH